VPLAYAMVRVIADASDMRDAWEVSEPYAELATLVVTER
jgi:hypothetical protein